MKEQYIRIQGAIDVLEHLLDQTSEPKIPSESIPEIPEVPPSPIP